MRKCGTASAAQPENHPGLMVKDVSRTYGNANGHRTLPRAPEFHWGARLRCWSQIFTRLASHPPMNPVPQKMNPTPIPDYPHLDHWP